MEIKRDDYLKKLIAKKHNGLIKVVTGIRRCGKSYLLFTLYKNHLMNNGTDQDHIIEIAFDSFKNKKYRDPHVLYPFIEHQIKDDGMYYILLDEVQLLSDFESVLNGLIRIRNVDVYVTGSNAKFLSKDIITEFRGRGDEVHMYPLSFAEFMSVYPNSKYDGWNEYMLYGGLPSILTYTEEEQKISFLKMLFDETYIQDIIGRNNIRNQDELEDLLNIISSAIGSLTNPKRLSDTFRSVKQKVISPVTVKKYLDYLCDAFLIDNALRYDIRGRKYINTPLKYYFTDVGLRNARLNFRQLEETHTMENIIFNELKIRGYNVDVGLVICNEKNAYGNSVKKQLEVDFVCNKGSRRCYIQSAFAIPDREKLEQEEGSLIRISDSFKKIIIAKNTISPRFTESGTLIINIFDFLLNENSLEY
ncbi:MAG: ATP-binding protein [Ruminococcaceae bacterium]|jgi:predicted AAA+ superfamily ATPase|nr:ATP-binding protein [Clostridiales bacterium]NLM79127.1 ATP-binding protein [Oscillospiraceae bacterium]